MWRSSCLPQFRGVRLGDEDPVVVMLKSTARGPIYYVEGMKTGEDELAKVIFEAAEKRETKAVAIKVDREATMSDRQVLINIIAGLNHIRIFEGYRQEER